MENKYKRIVRGAALAVGMLVASAGAWGQQRLGTITPTYDPNRGQSTEILYLSGSKKVELQEGTEAPSNNGGVLNLDGFIRWYIKKADGTETTEGLTRSGNSLTQYQNGYAWLRTDDNITGENDRNTDYSPANACSITVNVSNFPATPDTLIVEATSLNNASRNGNNITTPLITFQRKYVLRDVDATSGDLSILQGKRTNLNRDYSNWRTNSTVFNRLVGLSDAERIASYFYESYELHTPLSQGTNYRLSRHINNYFVDRGNRYGGIREANRVRWNVFKSDGSRVVYTGNDTNGGSHLEGGTNIWNHTFGNNSAEGIDLNAQTTQILYLVAEVANYYDTMSDFYPVAFIKLYLDPNAEPLTQNDLDGYSSNTTSPYYVRTDKYLEDYNYKEVASITFDENPSTLNAVQANPELNYSSTPVAGAQSYYAYAYPNYFQHRRDNRFSAGRGEYGLYRTLNYENVSKGTITINRNRGVYNDYFANHGYDYYILDRLYDTSNHTQLGYFMYLDASDDPGTITNIPIEDLCPDTRLVVSAWICDMATPGATKADVSFIFKGISGNGEETVLNRYQSGVVGTKEDGGRAQWQQVYFSFTFDGSQTFDSYVLEVANNAPNSNGADYAIDDIRCWRSTPNIEVIREDACDASTLTISSDYATLLNNMDWVAGEDIADVSVVTSDASLLKYRFGLQGVVGSEGYPVVDMHLGNTYFSFLEGLSDATGDWTNSGKSDVTTSNPDGVLGNNDYRWIRINKNLVNFSAQSAYSLRVVVSTDVNDIPATYGEAQKRERILNLRALNDYNYAAQNWETISNSMTDKTRLDWLGTDPIETALTEEMLNSDNISEEILNAYSEAMQELYSKLLIPRIRVPWYNSTTQTLYLSKVDVEATDLKTKDEVIGYDSNGNQILASGYYQVILFGAQEVQNGTGDTNDYLHKHDKFLAQGCNLISDFTVGGLIRIRVYTEAGGEGLICEGAQRHVEADLLNRDNPDEVLSEDLFGFDWFLGTLAEYNQLTEDGTFGGADLATAIKQYREDTGDDDAFSRPDVARWTPSSEHQALKDGLLEVFDDERRLLSTGTREFTLILDSESIVAMPYVKQEGNVNEVLYCMEVKEVPFDQISTDIPAIHPGLPGVAYNSPSLTQVPLRLGLRHVQNNKTLTIPLQEEIEFAVDGTTGHYLIVNTTNNTVILNGTYDGVDLPPVGRVDDLSVTNGSSNNSVTITFNQDFDFKEGETYTLLIPFSESANGTSVLGTACDGLARLPIRIVPEFLTWKGGSADKWYEDTNWNQSSKGEIYIDPNGTSTDDANGTDEDLTRAFSPLYFTKVTLLRNDELSLESSDNKADDDLTLNITDDVKYEMAIDTLAADETGYMTNQRLTIRPYYINKVDQIYFRPEATLLKQHYLTYNKARVEFEMTPNTAYWMASPLKDVYAGDMYAPTSGGQQRTPAFTDITYGDETTNNRWDPAFYQKAWDSGIQYAASDANSDRVPTDGEIASVNIVPSNWSIEYNDVTVPYSVGKGFYARVETETPPTDGKVMVRLPKADTDYKYEPATRALNTVAQKTSKPNMSDVDASGNVTIKLSDVDGDGNHFLIGNPYMAYIDIEKFLAGNNTVLGNKYWTISPSGTASVGTPDVDWVSEETTGNIAPMQAFFVERAGYNPESPFDETGLADLTVTFTPEMMVAQATATSGTTTRAYTASNPQLTLTASSANGKSRAAIVQRSDASNQYESDKDAVTLLDSELDAPTVYTVAGNYAAAVNAIHDYKNVPLGVYADADEEVELTIEGASQLVEPLYLYDAVTRSTTPIESDSYTLNLQGSSHGRYFLTTDEGITVESDIRIYSPADGQLIIASTPSDKLKQVQVYDLSGRVVDSRQNIGMTTCQISVPGGIYIIRAESEHGEAQAKLKVR